MVLCLELYCNNLQYAASWQQTNTPRHTLRKTVRVFHETVHYVMVENFSTFSQISWVNSEHFELPPRSPVRNCTQYKQWHHAKQPYNETLRSWTFCVDTNRLLSRPTTYCGLPTKKWINRQRDRYAVWVNKTREIITTCLHDWHIVIKSVWLH